MREQEKLTRRGQDLSYQAAMARQGGLRNQIQQTRQAQWLASKMEQSGLTGMDAAFGEYDKAVAASGAKPGEDIPGMGRFSNFPMANAFQGEPAQGVNNALQGVKNLWLAALSGKAVTPAEYERLAKQLGDSPLNSPALKMKAVEEIRNILKARIRNIRAGVTDPAVLKAYDESIGGGASGGGSIEDEIAQTEAAIRALQGPQE